MVQTVKRALRKVSHRSTLTMEELNTLLIEVESVINGRPLTFVYDDSKGISYLVIYCMDVVLPLLQMETILRLLALTSPLLVGPRINDTY